MHNSSHAEWEATSRGEMRGARCLVPYENIASFARGDLAGPGSRSIDVQSFWRTRRENIIIAIFHLACASFVRYSCEVRQKDGRSTRESRHK